MALHLALIAAAPGLPRANLLQQATPFDSLFGALANPNVAYLLLCLGFLGLFLELSSPGATIPGAVGVVSLILAAIGLSQLPFDWRGGTLILIAFLLFFADLFVPSLGLLTLGGLTLLVAGSYVLFDESRGASVARPLIWAIAAGLVAMFAIVGAFAVSVLRRKPTTGREGLIGSVGTVRQRLDPDGIVFVYGELWQATAPGDTPDSQPPIEPRVPVTVTGMDGLRIFVRRATVAEADAAGVATIGDRRPPESEQAALVAGEAP